MFGRVAGRLVASQEGLSSTDLAGYFAAEGTEAAKEYRQFHSEYIHSCRTVTTVIFTRQGGGLDVTPG
jgi:hypothetical protein